MIRFDDTCINNTFRGMVNITCVVVSGRRPLTIGWKVGGEDFTSDGHSMVVTINDTVSKLIIGTDTSASLDLDLNDYRCTATNNDGNDTGVSILTRCGKFGSHSGYKLSVETGFVKTIPCCTRIIEATLLH